MLSIQKNIRPNLSELFSRANIQFFILAIMVVSFPWSPYFSSIPSFALAIWYVLDKRIFLKLKTAFTQPLVYLFLLVPLWYAVWSIGSNNSAEAFATLERKIPFIIFPIIFASENYCTSQKINHLLMLLLASCIASAVVCEIYAFMHYHQTGSVSYFIYQDLSRTTFNHPGHMSNYYMLLIIWLVLMYLRKSNSIALPSMAQLIALIFIVIFVLQLTSKTILLFLVLFVPWCLYALLKNIKLNFKTIIWTLVTVICLVGCLFLFNKKIIGGRFNVINELQNLDSTVAFANSTGSRAVAIKEAFLKVKPVWASGYGTGQANNKLMEQLVSKNYSSLVQWEMHTHNQWMHVWLDIGLFGVLYHLFLFSFLAYLFVKRNNLLAFWFTILVMVNMLTDDMLEIQAGLVFFIFWIGLFLFSRVEKQKEVI